MVDPSVVSSITTIRQAWQNILSAMEQTGTTDANGEVTFNLPQGLYYVTETKNSGNTIPCDPFVVSVPKEDAASPGTWITDVHAYPKNQPMSIDKFVAAVGTTDYYEVGMSLPVAIGERFNWYIRTQLPTDINTKRAEYYVVTDILNSSFEYQPGTVKVYIMSYKDSDLKNCVVLSSGDYTVDFDTAANTLPVGLTTTGIVKVKKLVDSGERYAVVEYGCIVNDTAPQGVALYGDAKLEYTRETASGVFYRGGTQDAAITLISAGGNTGFTLLAGETTNTVTAEVAMEPAVHTGQIGITKVEDGTKKPLSGAEFGIAATKADAQAGKFIATGTTNPSGKLAFKGLKYGTKGDRPEENTGNTTFWLAETKAPDGYKLMADPVEITFNYQQESKTGEYYFARVAVYNVAKDASGSTGTSPKTGDESNMILYLALCTLSVAAIVRWYFT